MFGRLVHRMIEAHAQEEDPFAVLKDIGIENEKLFTAEKEMYGEIVEDLRIIMTDYFDFWKTDSLRLIPAKSEDGEYRFAEHEFAIDMGELTKRVGKGLIAFKGQVDGLGKTANGLRWLVEHKTHEKAPPSEDHRWRNLQSVVYFKAIRYLGWLKNPDGVAWNYIKTHPPSEPQLLKDGSRLSVKEITTLPSVVLNVLKRHGLSEESHALLMERAEASRREYFQRVYTPINHTVVDNIFSGFVDSAIEMQENHGRKKDMNLGRHCEWCEYEPICRAELTGSDVDWVKEKEFQHEDSEAYRRSGRKPGTQGAQGEKTRGTRSPKLRVVR